MERIEQGFAAGLPLRLTQRSGLAVDLRLYGIEFLNAPQRFLGDRRLGGFKYIEQLAPCMRQASDMGHPRSVPAVQPIQRLVAGESIGAQIAAEPFEMAAWPLPFTVGTVAVKHRRMACTRVGARVHGVTPEPRQTGLASARRQSADRGVVGPQQRLRHDVLADPLGQGEQPPGDVPHPFGHDSARDVDALAPQYARLPVERQPVAVFRDGNVG